MKETQPHFIVLKNKIGQKYEKPFTFKDTLSHLKSQLNTQITVFSLISQPKPKFKNNPYIKHDTKLKQTQKAEETLEKEVSFVQNIRLVAKQKES